MYVLAPNQTVEIFPYSIGDLRRDNPSTSFPRNPSADLLAAWNVFPVVERSAPSFDYATENCNQVNPTLENGKWVMTWEVTNASAEEIAERTAARTVEVRQERNTKLLLTDWRVVYEMERAAIDGLGVQYPLVWAEYRQALRDITTQDGFPHNVIWPQEPS